MRIFHLLILLLSTVCANSALAQEAPLDTKDVGERVLLADGSELFVKIVRNGIQEDGLSVEWLGARMQIEWNQLDASSVKGLRKQLLDLQNPDSIRSYAEWCQESGMKKDFETVSVAYENLTGKKLRSASDAPSGDLEEEHREDPESNPDPDPEGSDPDPEPAPVVKKKEERAKSGGKYLPIWIDGGKAKEIKADLTETLKSSGLTVKSKRKKGYAIIAFRSAEIKRGKNPRFFGSSLFVEYTGVAKIEILDANSKTVEIKEFETSLIKVYPKEVAHLKPKKGARSLASDEKIMHDYAKGLARESLVSSISSWARGILPREEVEE